jgi:putative toxin-antitoxin system antitoxin component (TIGR02293 family)
MKSDEKTDANSSASHDLNNGSIHPAPAEGYLAELSIDMPIAPSESLIKEEIQEIKHIELKAAMGGGKRFMFFYGDNNLPLHAIAWDEKIELIQDGISKADLMKLKENYGFTLEELSRILDITPRTIQGKALSDKFTGNVGEKILALAGLYSYGLEVFDDEHKYKRWLYTPSPVLKNFKPVELLSTMTGMEEVKHELGRIDYGVY